MPISPDDDSDISNAMNIARQSAGADPIQAKISGLNQFMTGLDLEANPFNPHTGLNQPSIGGAGMPVAPPRQLNDVGLYSHAAEQANTLQPRGDAKQMISTLKNMQGVKPEELQNAGLLDAQGNVHPEWAGRGKITNTDLANHLQSSMPQVQETVLGKLPTQKLKVIRNSEGYHDIVNPNGDIIDTYPRDLMGFEDATRAAQARENTDFSNVKYSGYTLPGGENYRELLLHLPNQREQLQKSIDSAKLVKENAMQNLYATEGMDLNSPEKQAVLSELKDAQAKYNALIDQKNNLPSNFQQDHFPDIKNLLAHLRMSDRTGPNGEKILHVEELQSDWGQKGRDQGFQTSPYTENDVWAKHISSNAPEGHDPSNYPGYWETFDRRNGDLISRHPGSIDEPTALSEAVRMANLNNKGLTPSAPYVTNTGSWTDLALKRALKEAAEGGYDKLVWTPGSEQAQRYDLSKQIDNLQYFPPRQNSFGDEVEGRLIARKDGRPVMDEKVNPNKLSDFIGKDVANNLLGTELQTIQGAFDAKPSNPYHYLEGQDLSVGGEGMKSYYDSIVPKQLQKITKQYDPNAKVGYTDVMLPPSGKAGTNNPPIAAPGIDITPQMRETIMRGQKAFKRGGMIMGNNAIGNAMRMALGGDAEIEMPHSLKELQDWKKNHPTPVPQSSMDDVFTNRVSGFEGAPPMAMPANLDELLAYLRKHHAAGGRAHFDDGGSSDTKDSSSDNSGNDNVRADALSQNQQTSADTQAAIDRAISQAGTDVRTGDTPGGLTGDTGGSSGMVSAEQSKIDAATAAAVDRAQQAREMQNRGSLDSNVGGGSGDYMGNVKYSVADVNKISDQIGGIYGVDPKLIQGMIKNESGYNLNAIGSAGEVGLMQVKPSTYMSPGYGVTPGTDVSNLANPYQNVDFATRYLLARSGGADLSTPEGQAKALAAYNSSGTQDARDAYVKATQTAMGQTVSPEKVLGDVTINPANSGIYAALAKGVTTADQTKTGTADAGGAGPEARNLFTNRVTDATDTSGAVDQAKVAAAQPSILEKIFGSNTDQIAKLENAGQTIGGDRDTVAAQLGVNPEDLKARIVMDNGQQKVDYYTKDLGQAVLGDAGNALTTGLGNLFAPKSSYDPTAVDNGMGNIKGVSSANDMTGPFDRAGHSQQMINNALAVAAPAAPAAPVAPYTTELSAGSLKLPSTTGQTAQQWADQNVGGDLSKVNARITYVNGAPRLEYYTK